jgi:hypothetical protein
VSTENGVGFKPRHTLDEFSSHLGSSSRRRVGRAYGFLHQSFKIWTPARALYVHHLDTSALIPPVLKASQALACLLQFLSATTNKNRMHEVETLLPDEIWNERLFTGSWEAGELPATPVNSPSNGQHLGALANASPNQVERSALKAATAQRDWYALAYDDRAKVMRKAIDASRPTVCSRIFTCAGFLSFIGLDHTTAGTTQNV